MAAVDGFGSQLPVVATVEQPRVVYIYRNKGESVGMALQRAGFTLAEKDQWPLPQEEWSSGLNGPILNDYATTHPFGVDFNDRVNRLVQLWTLGGDEGPLIR